jgi:hypothetical protein
VEDKVTTITVTPNYEAIFEQFRRDAQLHLNSFTYNQKKTFTRSEVYAFVAAMRIALGAATTIPNIEALRTVLDDGGEKMFAVLQEEQEPVETVCVVCNETNLLEHGEDLKTRVCDDCKRVGSVMLMSEYNLLPVAELEPLRRRTIEQNKR